jgi:hypothetical protein
MPPWLSIAVLWHCKGLYWVIIDAAYEFPELIDKHYDGPDR